MKDSLIPIIGEQNMRREYPDSFFVEQIIRSEFKDEHPDVW